MMHNDLKAVLKAVINFKPYLNFILKYNSSPFNNQQKIKNI